MVFNIFIHNGDRKIRSYSVSRSTKVNNLKLRVREQIGYTHVRRLHGGMQLAPGKTLADYPSIEDNSIIVAAALVSGG
ncbi:hypothetical protein HKX48_008390 [Thoreauomyces humboldtii]|nr:hypothetical protein HKX48_008390 [Thoreauomyces humboldtii]